MSLLSRIQPVSSSPFTLGTMTSRMTRSGGFNSTTTARLFAVSGLHGLHALVFEVADDDVSNDVFIVHHENV